MQPTAHDVAPLTHDQLGVAIVAEHEVGQERIVRLRDLGTGRARRHIRGAGLSLRNEGISASSCDIAVGTISRWTHSSTCIRPVMCSYVIYNAIKRFHKVSFYRNSNKIGTESVSSQ
jgi:hypothetical protein